MPTRSPGCGIACPERETRADTTTCLCIDSFAVGAMLIESSSVKRIGRSFTVARITANGSGGPSTARAKMNTASSGFAWRISSGASVTSPLMLTPAVAGAAAGPLAWAFPAATNGASASVTPFASAACRTCSIAWSTALRSADPGSTTAASLRHSAIDSANWPFSIAAVAASASAVWFFGSSLSAFTISSNGLPDRLPCIIASASAWPASRFASSGRSALAFSKAAIDSGMRPVIW